MPLGTLTPMVLEIDRRDLTNRVCRDEAWDAYVAAGEDRAEGRLPPPRLRAAERG